MGAVARLIAAVLVAALPAFPAGAGGLDDARAGEEAHKSGNVDEAQRLYGLAIQSGDLTDKQLAYVHYRRGSLRGSTGQNGAAIEDFSATIRLEPKHGYAQSLRGYLQGIAGRFAAAETDHKAALDLAPTIKSDTYLPWVLQHYADLRRRQRRFPDALELLERAFKAKEYPTAYFRRAWVHLDAGRNDQARAEYDRWVKATGGSAGGFWPDERAALERLKALPAR
jgi:tetratricopeptide (TPR) repeat protein